MPGFSKKMKKFFNEFGLVNEGSKDRREKFSKQFKSSASMVENRAELEGYTDVDVYGVISSDARAEYMRWLYDTDKAAVSGAMVKDKLENIDGDVRLCINSVGGQTTEGSLIETAVMEHRNRGHKVLGYNEGICASAATYGFLAADETVVGPKSMFGIHNSSVEAIFFGAFNSKDIDELINELEKAQDMMNQFDNILVEDYAEKSGNTENQIRNWMENEKVWAGKNTVDAGFAGNVYKLADNDDEGTKNKKVLTLENRLRDAGAFKMADSIVF